jgi:murein DD-endopeptidase MepM/ murein hydrolase activator NlpD
MLTKVSDYKHIEAENAQLRVDTKRLELTTHRLDAKLNDLESRADKITQAIESDGLFKKANPMKTAGGAKENLSTAELLGDNLAENVEVIRIRMADVEQQLARLDEKSKVIRSTPSVMPVNGRVGSSFGGRLDPFTGESETHPGLDIVAPFGSAVKAPADGVVVFRERRSDYGNLLILEHPNGLTTRYAHLRGFAVRFGQTVQKGDIIGYVGTTGRTTAPHLHYEVRLNDRPQNPLRYIRQ